MVQRICAWVGFGLFLITVLCLGGCCGIECQMLNIWREQNSCNAGRSDDADTSVDVERSDTEDSSGAWGTPDTSSAWNDQETGDTAGWEYSMRGDAPFDPGIEGDFDQNKEPMDESRMARTTAGNGFVYPLDGVSAWQNTYDYAGYGACGTSYYTNTCHNGTDIGAARGSSVYAIAAGTVVRVSGTQNSTCSSGWGYDSGGANTCNMAVAMQHYAADGSAFVVVYGHMVYDASVVAGDVYAPGDTIGVIANDYDWSSSWRTWRRTSSPHLHMGVFPGTSSPAVRSGVYGWGKLTCSGANQAANTVLPTSCTNNGSTAMGSYIGAKTWVEPPGAPMLSSPANGASVSSPVTLSWSNGSGAYRQHVMVCTNSSLTVGCINPDGDMTGAEPSTAFASSYSATLSTGTYSWAVRSIAYTDAGGWGSYSSVRQFTVR